MPELVECCVHNLTGDSREPVDRIDDEVRMSFCLDRCGTCYEGPFLVIDGKLQAGGSYKEILNVAKSE